MMVPPSPFHFIRALTRTRRLATPPDCVPATHLNLPGSIDDPATTAMVALDWPSRLEYPQARKGT